MENTKRSAAVNKIEKGVQKDKHINQYGDQQKDASKQVRDTSEKVDPKSATIDGRDNEVQENARKESQQKAQNQK